MNNYIIEIWLPEKPDSKFLSLIPQQREYVTRMMSSGVITSYALSMDRKNLWVIAHCKAIIDVQSIINSFPIKDYITYEIKELLFYELPSMVRPQFWLN